MASISKAEKDLAVLLIGSIGNGKSTLGNYLLDPKGTKEVFEAAVDNFPQTKLCKCVTGPVEIENPEIAQPDDLKYGIACTDDFSDSNEFEASPDESAEELESVVDQENIVTKFNFTVIDTPGLNEGLEHDLSHMIDLIKTLEEMKTINACILVVKFPCKIDQQFKDTVKYFSKLLPRLFEENVIIVMTHYTEDKYSRALRKRQKITPEVMKVMTKNVVKEIMEITPVNCEPILFAMDALPLSKEAVIQSGRVRGAMFSYVMSRDEVNVEDLKVCKMKALMEEDYRKIARLDGEISGYNQKLQELNMKAEAALNGSEHNEKKITDINSELDKMKRDLQGKDCEDLVSTKAWNVDNTRWFPWWRNSEFDLSSDYEIVEIKKWNNGECIFSDIQQDRQRVHGKLKGKFSRRLYARLTLYTTKRFKFAQSITSLKKDIEIKGTELKEAKERADSHKAKHKEFTKEISELETFIATKRGIISSLSNDEMSLSEANTRLTEIRSK